MKALHPKYPNMFSPIKIGPVEIPNRFYFAPHGVGLAVSTKPASDFPFYSAERVKGGCGLVINSLCVTERGDGLPVVCLPGGEHPFFSGTGQRDPRFWREDLRRDLVLVGSHRSVATAQSRRAVSGRIGLAVPLRRQGSRLTKWARDEIRRLIDANRQSTANLRQAGYDGVMLHCAHGAILEHFLSPYFNREDGRVRRKLREPFATARRSASRQPAKDRPGNLLSVCGSTATSCSREATARARLARS